MRIVGPLLYIGEPRQRSYLTALPNVTFLIGRLSPGKFFTPQSPAAVATIALPFAEISCLVEPSDVAFFHAAASEIGDQLSRCVTHFSASGEIASSYVS
jgi:hypothetical protein